MTDDAQKPQGKRERASADRRLKIRDAAMMCFLEYGFHQTGVRDIAARANVSLGNLYNHFPGKHDVLVEIAALEREELAPFVRQLSKTGPAVRQFDKFVASYAKYLSRPENVILTIEISSEAIRKPDLGQLFAENRSHLTSAIADLLRRGRDAQAFDFATDPEDAALMVLELLEGRAYHCVLNETKMRAQLPGLQMFLHAALGVKS
ncbi:TetR/AcrR family transcriptional regulator [Phaeobacter sp.]|uniref:TetR/AcrR family transcriptional regulator n=1 Tax=Phaeobacter sp. TaxID=1902409 RepID=UPI0025EC0657|nr:TetR/AcrR family transcriptional regulator [Phaeobacter sp.]